MKAQRVDASFLLKLAKRASLERWIDVFRDRAAASDRMFNLGRANSQEPTGQGQALRLLFAIDEEHFETVVAVPEHYDIGRD